MSGSGFPGPDPGNFLQPDTLARAEALYDNAV